MFRSLISTLSIAVVAAGVSSQSALAGLDVPFTEQFTNDNANWWNGAAAAPLDWLGAGGADGGGYVTTQYTVPDVPPPFGATLFRAQDEFGSSGGAFEGDWITAGANAVAFSIRHNASQPLDVFIRVAGPANFPGAVAISFAPIAPGVWTDVYIPVHEGSPNIIVIEGDDYDAVFSNVGHLQVGVFPGEQLAGENLTIDLDQVSIIPAPGAAALLGLAGLMTCRRRRR